MRGIDLFAGAGGNTTGGKMAGQCGRFPELGAFWCVGICDAVIGIFSIV